MYELRQMTYIDTGSHGPVTIEVYSIRKNAEIVAHPKQHLGDEVSRVWVIAHYRTGLRVGYYEFDSLDEAILFAEDLEPMPEWHEIPDGPCSVPDYDREKIAALRAKVERHV